MEFGCSVCGYTSAKKDHVVRHVNNKKSCGPGTKKVVEIPADIKCEYCDKDFTTHKTLEYHMKNSCKHKDRALKDQIAKLKEELKEARNVTIHNNSVKQDNSVNTVNIIIVNNYEDTSLEKLTDKIFNKIIKDSEEVYKLIPNLIKHVHFNPNIPENHNVYLSNRNKNNRHVQVFRNGHWEIEDKNTEIANLINDKETNLSDWVAEKGAKYPEAKEIYDEYMDQKFEDDTIKLVKDQVELVLYNGKNIIGR